MMSEQSITNQTRVSLILAVTALAALAPGAFAVGHFQAEWKAFQKEREKAEGVIHQNMTEGFDDVASRLQAIERSVEIATSDRWSGTDEARQAQRLQAEFDRVFPDAGFRVPEPYTNGMDSTGSRR